ncbi:hypothetical protein BDV12DRAFT_178841 [Aspergillus spectabilis]
MSLNGGSPLPPHYMHSQMSLIEVFFPGFSFISATTQQLLAGNRQFVQLHSIPLCFIILALFAHYAFSYVSKVARNYFSSYFTPCNCAYDMLVDWLPRQQIIDNAHSLIARVGSSQVLCRCQTCSSSS